MASGLASPTSGRPYSPMRSSILTTTGSAIKVRALLACLVHACRLSCCAVSDCLLLLVEGMFECPAIKVDLSYHTNVRWTMTGHMPSSVRPIERKDC